MVQADPKDVLNDLIYDIRKILESKSKAAKKCHSINDIISTKSQQYNVKRRINPQPKTSMEIY